MYETKYQRSECRGGYLHKFRIISTPKGGLYERCERCGMGIFFDKETPNWKYLEYHIREALQDNDPRFTREWPNAISK